jgi:hypothetical protein
MKTLAYYKGYEDYKAGKYDQIYFESCVLFEKRDYRQGWNRGFDEQADKIIKGRGYPSNLTYSR